MRYFSSESVTEGHPDKMCDQISDALLDAPVNEPQQADRNSMFILLSKIENNKLVVELDH